MQKMIIAGLLFLSFSSHAQFSLSAVKENFAGLQPASMAPGKLYFNLTTDPPDFPAWKASAPTEYVLKLIPPGWEEPTMFSPKLQTPTVVKAKMYVARSKFLVAKAPAAIDLAKMLNIESIKALDPQLMHDQADPARIMPIVGGTPGIENFKALCNQSGENIFRPAKEQNLSVLQRPGQPWCSDPNQSKCVQSCYIFTSLGYTAVISAYNAAFASDAKDFGIATESEIRYFKTPAEMGKTDQDFAALTGIKTNVRGILEQNIFYANQLLQYGKLVAVIQDHPTDPNQSVVSAYVVYAIQTSAYSKEALGYSVKNILLGKDKRLNTKSGITAGLPKYTTELLMGLAGLLQN